MLGLEILEYLTPEGKSPFGRWFGDLDAEAAAKVAVALARLGQGNFSNVASVGGGASELKVHFGPGYRIYFGRDGGALVILLCGGSKKRQSDDIERARAYWADYKHRRKGGK
jgi:putative addiction module killer protein